MRDKSMTNQEAYFVPVVEVSRCSIILLDGGSELGQISLFSAQNHTLKAIKAMPIIRIART